MATRAHSTPVPASRRRLPAAPAALDLPQGGAPKPRRVRKPAVKSPVPPAQAIPSALAMPGPAAMLMMLCQMWDDHYIADRAAGELRKADKMSEGEAQAIAASVIFDRIQAMEALAVAAAPNNLADAVAQLILAHAEIENRCKYHDDAVISAVPAVLEGLLPALRLIALAGGFDPASLGDNYLTGAEAMIFRGEVVA